MKIIYVKWNDAIGKSGWFDKYEPKKHDFIHETVGFEMKSNKHHITLCQSRQINGDGIGEPLAIPKSSILTKKYLNG